MKAIGVIPERREIKLVECDEPRITHPTDVKLRMLEVGVCGTDKEICAFDYGTPPDGSDFLILGHESLGEVVEVGPGVGGLKPGDMVVPTVRRPCHHAHCLACQADQQDFCYTGDFTERGIKMRHGFMTEFVVDDQRFMNRVPAKLREVGVLVEPLTIAEKALTQVWHVQQRLPWACPVEPGKERGHCHTAVVLGAGPVGLLGAMALCAADFETFVYSRDTTDSPKAQLVHSIGATYISAGETSVEQLAERVGNIDVVYEAAGASQVAFDTIKVLGINGIFVFTGVPGRKGPINVDADQLMRNLVLKNQDVFGTVNAGRDAFEGAIRDLDQFMQRWPDAVRALITGRFPMEEHRELLLGRAGGIKNVITLN